MSDERSLEQNQLLQLHSLTHRGNIIDQGGGELLRFQPKTCKCMTLGKHYYWIEPDLLQGSTEKQRQIHAGCQAGIGNLARAAHLLT
ncbi:hypothetical protein D3C79_951890 [compost metagenome]